MSDVEKNELITVSFILKDGTVKNCRAKQGCSILNVAKENEIDLEGACGGCLSCATCHVIVDEKFSSKLNDISDDENEMLDQAFGLRETSRLGCQIVLDKNLDGIIVQLPADE